MGENILNRLYSYSDYNNLLKILNGFYNIDLSEIHLHREIIGYVYFTKNSKKTYVLKLYRNFNTEEALQSIEIIQYLKHNNYPVVSIVQSEIGSLYIRLNVPQGQCIGILFEYIEGVEPNLRREISHIGHQVGELHNLMKKYPNPLIERGKEFYIDRFISMAKRVHYPSEKVKELEIYGEEIWSNIKRLPKGFCHGDLHSGNMLKTKSDEYVLFDFDIASYSNTIIDVATLSNDTNFNILDESQYDSTIKKFEKFYQGYSKKRSLSDVEIVSIFDFIAARHYELIATITECQGLNSLDESFLDQQFDWLMKWRTICNRRRI